MRVRAVVRGLMVVVTAVFSQAAGSLRAQQPGGRPAPPEIREATRLDLAGETARARAIFQSVLDSATDPAARAGVERAIAMSYAFDGDCGNAVRHQRMAIDHWRTREVAEPREAFFQEGELANEVARVCLDAGDLAAAERWYRTGYDYGMKEPAPREHPASLWEYRLAHALGRLAARRGEPAEAWREVERARRILDGDSAMAAQQERFYPYLVGYVALYTGDLSRAESALKQAISLRGNTNDPFMHVLLGITYERMGRAREAEELYRRSYAMARAHNPPAAFVRPFVRKKLHGAVSDSVTSHSTPMI